MSPNFTPGEVPDLRLAPAPPAAAAASVADCPDYSADSWQFHLFLYANFWVEGVTIAIIAVLGVLVGHPIDNFFSKVHPKAYN